MQEFKNIKSSFPIFSNNPELVFLDNASTSQKPQMVIDAINEYYTKYNSNVGRGVYKLAEITDNLYQSGREKIASFINANSANEIVFVKNGTEAANLVSYSMSGKIASGDKIVVTELEHHSNYLPWLELAKRKQAQFEVIPFKNNQLSEIDQIINEKTKIVAVTQMSNVLGIQPQLQEIMARARDVGAVVILDAVQGIAQKGLDVKAMDVDFAFVSVHKMFGPMGIGFLYGKSELLENMPAFMTGGGMIKELNELNTEWLEVPNKFEAGTPNPAGVYATIKAIDFIEEIGTENIYKHNVSLANALREKLAKISQIRLLGKADTSIISFTIDRIHPHDIASIFANNEISIRAGHHCSKPLMNALDLNATARISFQIYNNEKELEKVLESINEVIKWTSLLK
ncbi:aminotransferase class V-fold PLP-dependent enzyme [Candidatus Peregrinibacteria bacterium]|nr:aminotransferase class V-fold PLP-dependent enzyme [Candidatus Peregrinibacteria bacterium]